MSFDLEQLKKSFLEEFDVGDEQVRNATRKARELKNQAVDSTKGQSMVQSYRTGQAVKNILSSSGVPGLVPDKDFARARADEGIGFNLETPEKRLGTLGGAIASDVTQDSLRRFWWLINAAQATGDIIAEEVIQRARPELYKTKEVPVVNKTTGQPVLMKDGSVAKRQQRIYGAGRVQLLAAPAGIAINTGLGLMTPFGGAEGYKAALPSEDDPSKTSNVIGEVAAKYFLGRTGDLLPYDDFVKVRPDVSKDEYQRYKAFKFDKTEDYNPFDDGDVSALMGAVRFTDEGIHGPEVQFLGRSLPVTTGIIPFATTVGGAALGVAKVGPKTGLLGYNQPVRRGLGGAVAGLLGGNVVGNLIEGERRRRNATENESDKL